MAIGVVVALAALPSFTDSLSRNIGGFVFNVVIVAVIVRRIIAAGEAFMQGWREPRGRVSR